MFPAADGAPSQADRPVADKPARRLTAFQTLVAALGHGLTPADAADIITRQVMDALGAGLVLLCRLSEDGTRYQIIRALGAQQAEAEAWAEFPVVSRVPVADAVRARQPLYFQSWQEREASYPHSDQAPTPERGGALAALPLLVGDRAVGGLGVILPEGRAFDDEDRDFLQAVAQLSADALERARLHELKRARIHKFVQGQEGQAQDGENVPTETGAARSFTGLAAFMEQVPKGIYIPAQDNIPTQDNIPSNEPGFDPSNEPDFDPSNEPDFDPSNEPVAPERRRILIVDDSPEDRAVIARVLRLGDAAIPFDDFGALQVEVREADTVAAALRALRREEFACIFLDHFLPDGTSLDLLAEVRAQDLAVPIVVMTGHQDEGTIIEVMRAGAVDYLPKRILRQDTLMRSLRMALLFGQAQRERQTSLDALRRSEERLILGTQVASLALMEVDYDTNLTHLSVEAAHLFGLGTSAMTVPRSTVHATFHPGDAAALEKQIQACLDPKGTGWFAMDHRVVWPNGETRWLRVRKQVFFAGEGAARRPARAMLAAFDVTAEKAVEEALRDRNALLAQKIAEFQTLFDLLPVTVLIADDRECLRIRANAAGQRLLSVPPEANVSMSAGPGQRTSAFRVMREGRDVPAEELPMQVAAATGQAVNGSECLIVRSDGSESVIFGYSSPLLSEDGTTRGCIGAFLDVTSLKRLEAEREARAQREALLGRIGQALRRETDPEQVLEIAVRLLGEALGADRCYYALYDLESGLVNVAYDWHRAGLATIQGPYRFPNTAQMFRELYGEGNTSVITDTQAAPLSDQTKSNMGHLDLRSRVSASLRDRAGFMATLTAAMADKARSWTDEEVALVEDTATLVRVAVEAARIARREHRLAAQFQAALQPPVPSSVPGLSLASFYRPAWEDHGVGGDFSDVFAADKGISYLIVGDLAGKGIPAANQVATVRNMLRFALYNGSTMSEALTSLNTTLAENNLLDGFATLFVGRYDAEARTLTYVNAGQDAGLVLRAATGEVVALPPTGPVLGVFAGVSYMEASVTLAEGDGVALYTDGLTEAGPTRLSLLTGDGVADLLGGMAGVQDPQVIVERLMAGVDAHAGLGVRDDQCLLVGVVAQP